MKGLIIKDILNLKRQAKLIGAFAILYTIMAFYMNDTNFISGIIILMCSMFSISSFAYDDLAKWDKYALSMPVSRKDVVMSKYTLTFILAFSGAFLSLIISFLVSVINKIQFNTKEQLLITLSIVGVSLVFTSILTPLIYKFGTEKARLMIIVVAVIPTVLFNIISNAGIQMPSQETLTTLGYIAPFTIIAIVIVSYFISVSIYQKKEI